METKVFRHPVLDFINTLCNFTALNLIFLITCLPVVTLGAALSSLYYVMLREARGEYGYLVRTYFREFKKNLKVGTITFTILFIIGAVLLFNMFFWFLLGSLTGAAVAALMAAGLLLWYLTFLYTFPLVGRFENTALQTLKNAFCLAMSNVRMTLALLLLDAFFFFLCLFWEPMKLFMVLTGFVFTAYCRPFLFNRVFAPYETETDDDTTMKSGGNL